MRTGRWLLTHLLSCDGAVGIQHRRELPPGVIETDDQMLLAQQCIDNLRRVLIEARNIHSRHDYTRMAQPILLEIQERQQEILEYLSREMEQPVAS